MLTYRVDTSNVSTQAHLLLCEYGQKLNLKTNCIVFLSIYILKSFPDRYAVLRCWWGGGVWGRRESHKGNFPAFVLSSPKSFKSSLLARRLADDSYLLLKRVDILCFPVQTWVPLVLKYISPLLMVVFCSRCPCSLQRLDFFLIEFCQLI